MLSIDLDRWLYESTDEVCSFAYGVEFIEVATLMDLAPALHFPGNTSLDHTIHIINQLTTSEIS